MEDQELEEMVEYYANLLQNEKIELLNRKRQGINQNELQKKLTELKAIKNIRDILEVKLIKLEEPAGKEYNMYCPYAAECKKEGKKCEGGKCKEYQWGK